MKKERHCGAPYPVYPQPLPMYPQPGMPYPQNNTPVMPIYPQNGIMPDMGAMTPVLPNIESQMNAMMNQISNLERRVTALENTVGPTNYNNSNYQMM